MALCQSKATLPTYIIIQLASNSYSFSSSPSTTVIVINGSNEATTNTTTATNNKPNSNHRSVTKPRDVKNKSNRTKMILRMNTSSSSLLSTSSSSSPPNSKSPSPPIVITDKLIQQSGSVYCSLFGGDLSEEDIQNHHKKQIHHSSYAWNFLLFSWKICAICNSIIY